MCVCVCVYRYVYIYIYIYIYITSLLSPRVECSAMAQQTKEKQYRPSRQLGVVANEKGAFWSPSTMSPNFTNIYIYIYIYIYILVILIVQWLTSRIVTWWQASSNPSHVFIFYFQTNTFGECVKPPNQLFKFYPYRTLICN